MLHIWNSKANLSGRWNSILKSTAIIIVYARLRFRLHKLKVLVTCLRFPGSSRHLNINRATINVCNTVIPALLYIAWKMCVFIGGTNIKCRRFGKFRIKSSEIHGAIECCFVSILDSFVCWELLSARAFNFPDCLTNFYEIAVLFI
jgi:hypothetical protein